MCLFQSEHTVLVCPVAVEHVRARLHEVFGELVHCAPIDGRGTLIQIPSNRDSAQFQTIVREAIAAAQESPVELAPFHREEG